MGARRGSVAAVQTQQKCFIDAVFRACMLQEKASIELSNGKLLQKKPFTGLGSFRLTVRIQGRFGHIQSLEVVILALLFRGKGAGPCSVVLLLCVSRGEGGPFAGAPFSIGQ
jgi:hypothetical protein